MGWSLLAPVLWSGFDGVAAGLGAIPPVSRRIPLPDTPLQSRWQAYVEWVRAAGGSVHSHLTFKQKPWSNGMRGLFATGSIRRGELLLEVPGETSLSDETLDRHFPLQRFVDEHNSLALWRTLGLAYLLRHRVALKPWLDLLPTPEYLPVLWPVSMLGSEWHHDFSVFGLIRQRRSKLEREIAWLRWEGYFDRVGVHPDDFRWAYAVLSSRAFSRREGESYIPCGCDFANHQDGARSHVWLDATGTGATLFYRDETAFEAGDEIFNNYGAHVDYNNKFGIYGFVDGVIRGHREIVWVKLGPVIEDQTVVRHLKLQVLHHLSLPTEIPAQALPFAIQKASWTPGQLAALRITSLPGRLLLRPSCPLSRMPFLARCPSTAGLTSALTACFVDAGSMDLWSARTLQQAADRPIVTVAMFGHSTRLPRMTRHAQRAVTAQRFRNLVLGLLSRVVAALDGESESSAQQQAMQLTVQVVAAPPSAEQQIRRLPSGAAAGPHAELDLGREADPRAAILGKWEYLDEEGEVQITSPGEEAGGVQFFGEYPALPGVALRGRLHVSGPSSWTGVLLGTGSLFFESRPNLTATVSSETGVILSVLHDRGDHWTGNASIDLQTGRIALGEFGLEAALQYNGPALHSLVDIRVQVALEVEFGAARLTVGQSNLTLRRIEEAAPGTIVDTTQIRVVLPPSAAQAVEDHMHSTCSAAEVCYLEEADIHMHTEDGWREQLVALLRTLHNNRPQLPGALSPAVPWARQRGRVLPRPTQQFCALRSRSGWSRRRLSWLVADFEFCRAESAV